MDQYDWVYKTQNTKDKSCTQLKLRKSAEGPLKYLTGNLSVHASQATTLGWKTDQPKRIREGSNLLLT